MSGFHLNVPIDPDTPGCWVNGGVLFGDKIEVQHWVGAGCEDWHRNAVMSIRAVFDPEIPVNIYDLGLIYKIETLPGGTIKIDMTLTSPSCPEAESLPGRVETNLMELPDTKQVVLELVWDPYWGPERMSEETRLELNFY